MGEWVSAGSSRVGSGSGLVVAGASSVHASIAGVGVRRCRRGLTRRCGVGPALRAPPIIAEFGEEVVDLLATLRLGLLVAGGERGERGGAAGGVVRRRRREGQVQGDAGVRRCGRRRRGIVGARRLGLGLGLGLVERRPELVVVRCRPRRLGRAFIPPAGSGIGCRRGSGRRGQRRLDRIARVAGRGLIRAPPQGERAGRGHRTGRRLGGGRQPRRRGVRPESHAQWAPGAAPRRTAATTRAARAGASARPGRPPTAPGARDHSRAWAAPRPARRPRAARGWRHRPRAALRARTSRALLLAAATAGEAEGRALRRWRLGLGLGRARAGGSVEAGGCCCDSGVRPVTSWASSQSVPSSASVVLLASVFVVALLASHQVNPRSSRPIAYR